MPCYLLSHQPLGEFSQESLLDCGRRLVAALPKSIKWRLAWYLPEENVVLCHWDAPGPEAIRAVLDQAGIGQLMQLQKIEEVVEIHPEWLGRPKRGRPRGSGKVRVRAAA